RHVAGRGGDRRGGGARVRGGEALLDRVGRGAALLVTRGGRRRAPRRPLPSPRLPDPRRRAADLLPRPRALRPHRLHLLVVAGGGGGARLPAPPRRGARGGAVRGAGRRGDPRRREPVGALRGRRRALPARALP